MTNMINHKIKVDSYISMDIMIPEEMDAMEFKAITLKANQIFKISQVQEPVKRSKRKSYGFNFYTQDKIDYIVELRKQGYSWKELAKKFNEKYNSGKTWTALNKQYLERGQK